MSNCNNCELLEELYDEDGLCRLESSTDIDEFIAYGEEYCPYFNFNEESLTLKCKEVF